MHRGLKITLATLPAILVIACVAFAAIAWHPAIDPVDPSPPSPGQVASGARLATLGDCATCHSASGGRPYAGGYGLPTPFGVIETTNITPDPETGIGRWSLAAFTRAMRQGVDRDGRNLYPALPYDHFTRMNDQDLADLYAFLQSLPPVQADRKPNRLPFPLNWRPLLAGWNLLFLDDRRYVPDPTHDAVWNRGAYLVDGVAHCGGCHTPRNALGAERGGQALAGGKAEGWIAWPLAGAGWNADSLYAYLRTGLAPDHGAAAGPMAPVTWNLAHAPEADVRAIAIYVASLSGPAHPAPAQNPGAMADSPGAAIFAGACASCHGPTSPMHAAGAPYLNTSTSVRADDPGNVLRVILGGIPPDPARAGPQMPAYAGMLNDARIAEIAAYVRARYAPDRPAWSGLADAAAHIRKGNPS